MLLSYFSVKNPNVSTKTRFLPSGTFIWTNRGGKHPLLLVEGYTYSYQKRNADGRISWYCSRRLKGCRAAAISFGSRVVSQKPHDHVPPKLALSDRNIVPTFDSLNPLIHNGIYFKGTWFQNNREIKKLLWFQKNLKFSIHCWLSINKSQ